MQKPVSLTSQAALFPLRTATNVAPTSLMGTIRLENNCNHQTDILISNIIIKGGVLQGDVQNALMSILTDTDHRSFAGNVSLSCPVNYKLHYYEKNEFLSFGQKCDSKEYSVEFSYIFWSNVEK